MTGPATFRLWVAFGIKPWDDTSLASDVNWTDITADARSGGQLAGRSHRFNTSVRSSQFDTFGAGRGMFFLDNRTREYDAGYASGSYYGNIVRHVPVRVTAEHSSTRYTVWRGFANRWTKRFEPSGRDSVTTLECYDGLGVLRWYELNELSSDSYESDSASTRIGRVLDAAGVPAADRSLNNGGQTELMAATTWGVNSLRHVVDVATADGGMFYADRDGTFTHDSRGAVATETRQSTSQVTVSDFDQIQFATHGDNFRDLVRVSSKTGDPQEVDNTAANDAPVVFQKLRTQLLTDGGAAATAKYYADLYSTETDHPTRVGFHVASGSVDARTALLLRQLRDRVTVDHDPPGAGGAVSYDCFIDGIFHEVSADEWRMEWRLSSADAYDNNLSGLSTGWLILDTGNLGTNTLGY